jgi:beta-barrel assembly-enhancing protease
VGTLAQATQTTAALHYSREFEREADRESVLLTYKAGFDPGGILSMFHTFQADSRLNASDLPPYFSTHPDPADRSFEVRNWLQAMDLPEHTRDSVAGFDLARLTARLRTEEPEPIFAEQEARARDNPQNARAQFLLGYLYLKRGDLSLAEQCLDRARGMDPSSTDYELYLARELQLAGKPDEAENLLQGVLAQEPGSALAQLFYGDLLTQLGKNEEALSHYNRALIDDPQSPAVETSLGMAYGRMEHTGESYYHLGLADKYAGRYLKAQHYFKKALKLLPPKSKEALAVKEEISWIEGEG